jgi:tRNA (cmo5U34)-methyltransferase
MTKRKDRLFARPGQNRPFRFDEQVADVFDDMIQRSVPGYRSILSMIGWLSSHHAQAGSLLYDLGASLGGASRAMLDATSGTDCRVVAVDNSPAMIERLQHALHGYAPRLDIRCSDIRDIDICNASVVVMNLVLQFVDTGDRDSLLARIHDGILPGGALLLTEKISFSDATRQTRMTELYYAFKQANGYSELEIAQKRAALEDVLICDTLECHVKRLQAAGFRQVDVWFQALNFMSLIALR